MKKELLLGLLLIGATANAANFSFTNEIKANVEENYHLEGQQKDEWTIARGYYKFSDDFRFKFDVDKDYYSFNSDYKDAIGWDTYAGFEKRFDEIEIFGKEVKNRVSLDYYWDELIYGSKALKRKESELGLSFTSYIQLRAKSRLRAKLWGRRIEITDSETTTYPDGARNVYGLELNYLEKFNSQWKFSATISGFYGGYTLSSGNGTFTNDRYKSDRKRDGFNYEITTYLENQKPLYKNDKLDLDLKTTFAAEMYGQGKDYDKTTSQYTKTFIRTGLVGEYEINDKIKLYGEARYNIFGQYAYSDSSKDNYHGRVRDCNEFEAIAGFTVRL